jgi:hypothetical protein
VAWETVEGYLVFDSLDEYYSQVDSDDAEEAEPGSPEAQPPD